MAIKGYVLVETAVGRSQDVVHELRSLPRVRRADVVTGPHEVIAVVEVPDLNALGDLVTEGFHKVDGVTRTVTCLRLGGR